MEHEISRREWTFVFLDSSVSQWSVSPRRRSSPRDEGLIFVRLFIWALSVDPSVYSLFPFVTLRSPAPVWTKRGPQRKRREEE